MTKKHIVTLDEEERRRLLAVVSVGRNQAQVIRRAHILLKSDEGRTDREIAEQLYTSEDTVERTRQRYCEDGLEAALHDRPRPGAQRALSDAQEAYLTALACTDPPEGSARWTLEMLTERLMADGVVEKVSVSTVRLALKKRGSSPGR